MTSKARNNPFPLKEVSRFRNPGAFFLHNIYGMIPIDRDWVRNTLITSEAFCFTKDLKKVSFDKTGQTEKDHGD